MSAERSTKSAVTASTYSGAYAAAYRALTATGFSHRRAADHAHALVTDAEDYGFSDIVRGVTVAFDNVDYTVRDARNEKPKHSPATPELRESWFVLNPYGEPVHYPTYDDALTAAQTGIY